MNDTHLRYTCSHNNDIDQTVAAYVRIYNKYVRYYQGKKQLSTHVHSAGIHKHVCVHSLQYRVRINSEDFIFGLVYKIKGEQHLSTHSTHTCTQLDICPYELVLGTGCNFPMDYQFTVTD